MHETKGGSTSPEPTIVKSAERTLKIIDLLAQTSSPLSFSALSAALGYPQSSMHGLLQTLQVGQWVHFDEKSREYSLGIKAWEAGNAYTHAVSLAERARPYMDRVRDALNETVQLAVLDGRHNVYIAKSDGAQRLVLESRVGSRLTAHATAIGKVLLAGLSDSELNERIAEANLERYTDNTVINKNELRKQMAVARTAGYATEVEEYTVGVSCVAVPVFDSTGDTIAAMSVSMPLARLSATSHGSILAELHPAASELSHALGHRIR